MLGYSGFSDGPWLCPLAGGSGQGRSPLPFPSLLVGRQGCGYCCLLQYLSFLMKSFLI